ncbi:MAG: o-succinylbenzoate synthase [Actinomycetota bacterium]|nr:o-succinylbenzoate synthase [Actinomycetota bacterium]
MPGLTRVYAPLPVPVTIRSVELLRIRLPLTQPFRTASSTTAVKDALLIKVVTPDSCGWGECTAQVTSSYVPETIDTARLALRDVLVPRLFAGVGFGSVRGHNAAKAALSQAVLDAQLRADEISLAAHLGGTATHVEAGVAVGMQEDLRVLLETVAGYAADGYRSMKLKIMRGHDIDTVAAVRAEVGPDVTLQVDANGSYAPADTDHLERLDAYDLACFEQPLAPDALLDHARLASRLRTPIGLDESITSASVARDAMELGACRVVSIKTGLLGGLDEARRTLELCRTAGIAARAGGMLETGVGRAALVALASLPGFSVPGDLSASSRYFAQDLTEPFELDDGRLAVPAGPGIGVTPLPDVLARCTIARERIDAR